MPVLSVGLLVALIVIFIWIKWDDKHKWESVYEVFGHNSKALEARQAAEAFKMQAVKESMEYARFDTQDILLRSSL